jgi:uncharacterized YigZ family protein
VPASAYRIPIKEVRSEIERTKSRFICIVTHAATQAEAKEFISRIKTEFPDATHHVYAYRAGFGNSFIEGMSDDGEPSGTAAPPLLAILRGSGLGDIAVVVVRYYGGTNLGTGGLVRAYGDALRSTMESLKTEMKVERTILQIALPYPLYETVQKTISKYDGEILQETFEGEILIKTQLLQELTEKFIKDILGISAGNVLPKVINQDDADMALYVQG